MLSAGDDKYSALVLQEDPEAQQPWAYTVAAFKYAGGKNYASQTTQQFSRDGKRTKTLAMAVDNIAGGFNR